MLGEIVHNLNYDRFKWSFQLFLGINLLSKATFSRHILCRLWMTILSLLTSWFVKGFWSWDVFYTPGWILTGIVVIFAKNQQKKIWEATGLTVQALKGQYPDYAHARASSVFSLKDNRTVILTRQDFLPDRTADRDL